MNNGEVWKTISVGNNTIYGIDWVIFFEEHTFFSVGSLARNALMNKSFSCSKKQFNLVIKRPKDFGFKDVTMYKDICKKAISCGFGMCPAYIAPVLRKEYEEQPFNDVLNIAMSSMLVHGFGSAIFNVIRMCGRFEINCTYGEGSFLWTPEHKFVFTLQKK